MVYKCFRKLLSSISLLFTLYRPFFNPNRLDLATFVQYNFFSFLVIAWHY